MTTAVDANSEGTVIRRGATPYGTPLAGSGTWPDDRAFLGDPSDPGTGLVTVGAREYDPGTALFVSPDPVLDTATPQAMTGYTYAAGDPVSSSDPTGQCPCLTDGSTERQDPDNGSYGDGSGGVTGGGYGGGGSSGAGGGGWGASGAVVVNVPCMRFGLGCTDLGSVSVPSPPGGGTGFLAGLLYGGVSLIDLAVCTLCVAARVVLGTPDLSSLYLQEVRKLGVDTNTNSTFTSGLVTGDILLFALGGEAGSAGNIADAAGGDAEVPAFSRSAYGRVPNATRGQVLSTNPTCVYCGQNPASQVDHIASLKSDWESGGWMDEQPIRTARINDPGNLTGACASCNGSKSASPIGTGPGEWWPPGWPIGQWWHLGGP
jgi:RHS repeat-associated protein